MPPRSSHLTAFVSPFLAFMAFIGLGEALHALFKTHGSMLVSAPQYWTYPTQTLLCGALLWWFWPSYSLQFPKKPVFTILIAILVLAIWILPQAILGRPHRLEGFNPDIFEKIPRSISRTSCCVSPGW